MKWKVHGERRVHESAWLDVSLLDVEQPDGNRYEHHAVRLADVAATALVDDHRRVLLLWRHRLVTDTWGWELPMGVVEAGETPEQTAARETVEETGWRPGELTPLIYAQPAGGIMDAAHHVFRARPSAYVGPPVEENEADRTEWVPLTEIRGMIARREIVSSATLVGLLHLLLDDAR
ncbi:NUDIX hydrolase [Streptomyces sp. GC420]|uniref:NUDIX hydrolase n=1 Tax=Streptomyces sp. GC420 TaxID=2697568 RepID=UPI001414F043|nr:NUDIX hydrolase [Streptomyces sp. GC420]NBM17912.1 NUDIX domain-containing protein [Streptomyces sp. GC420]